MPMDLPPLMHERVACSISAAAKYEIPANIMLAVAEKESGKPGQWIRNDNGTYDVGPLQFNTAYLRQLANYGIRPDDVAVVGCYPYELAAWRLRQHITKDLGDLWTRCANYHSRTPRFNEVYRTDLMKRAARWADWLAARYATHEIALFSAAVNHAVTARNASSVPMSQQEGRLWNWKSAPFVPRRLLVNGQP